MSKKLWGGRFEVETDKIIGRYNASIGFDQRLYAEDIAGSIAHATMLGKQGIIREDEARQIVAGLAAVKTDIEADPSLLTEEHEDIHMNVEALLRAKIGPVAGKLHTARSRNDQVATDLRLWTGRKAGAILQQIGAVQSQFVQLSEQSIDVLLPGTTHLQHAQPVRLAHHLMTYFWMLERDRRRFQSALAAANILPLGSGALAGTTFPIDREFVAEQLGFSGITANSLDGVSDRDFVLDTIYACSMLMMHLSRFAGEIVLWSTPEFGYVTLGDAVTTGSSIMPQKKNPDVMELMRGKSSRVFGDLATMLSVMKGLPLTYGMDMQEDKEALFDAVDTVDGSLAALSVVLDNITFNASRMAQVLSGDFSTATDLADYLATKGLPFREAHEIVGKIVAGCIRDGKTLEELTAADLAAASSLFVGAPEDMTSVEASVERRNIPGGTGRSAVLKQIESAKRLRESEAAN